MKFTGIVRKIDDLGRLTIPREIRSTLGINLGDDVEIFVSGHYVIMKKHEPNCLFCGAETEITIYQGRPICNKCAVVIHSHFAKPK